MSQVHGLHHVTAIAGDARENLDFYSGVLGMRLVKRSVNQDEPGTYHLFYADAVGSPGSDLTFFPWPNLPPARKGHGLTVEVGLAVPAGSIPFWQDRLGRARVHTAAITSRFGERVLPFTDPHGLELALVETEREAPAWTASPVPAERQVRGLHHVRLWERDPETTSEFMTRILGFRPAGEDAGWRRWTVEGGGSGTLVDLATPAEPGRGAWGTGGVHHVAWRVADGAEQVNVRREVEAAGRRPTPVIDRFWFQSVYFLEPGGVLFELATDGPGFGVDEDASKLGERLILPPWLEPRRAEIERVLPPLDVPARR